MTIKTQQEIERRLARWAKTLDSAAAVLKKGLNTIGYHSVEVTRRLERLADHTQPVFKRNLAVLEVVVLKRQQRWLGNLIRRRRGEEDQKPPDCACRSR